MPLTEGKSQHAFEENLKTEKAAGKSMKQSLAIAYAVKKRNNKNKMAKGGMVPCYDKGGEVERDEEDIALAEMAREAENEPELDFDFDLDESMEDLKDDHPTIEDVDNQQGDPSDDKKNQILSKILGSIRNRHMGKK